MFSFVESAGPLRTTLKWIVFWGFLTLTTSRRMPPARSDLSGEAFTARLSALWLVAATASFSTVQHDEVGIELRIGPLATYHTLEIHRELIVR